MSDSSSTSVAIRVLGPIRVRLPDGSASTALAKQRKRFALAVYLSLQRDPVPRETVAALLWPELDERASRRALRQAMHFLREALGTDAIVSNGIRELAVDRERLWCDAAALREAHAEGEPERVVELYRGELLEGFHVEGVASEFEYWLDGERRWARDRAVEAYRDLIRARREANRDAEAIELARRALELSPTDEISLRSLMRLLDERGDRLEAIEVYESIALRIRERLGADPSAETRGLVESIRERRDPVELDEATTRALPEFGKPTVGRDDEIVRCLRMLERGETWLTLTGPGGIGKSRLAVEIAAAWRERAKERVVFVPLSASGPDDVRDAVVARLGLAPRRDPWGEIERELGRQRTLLVLDGFEASDGAVTRIAGLASERVRVLVTSTAPLRLVIEAEFPVPPLGLPATDRPVATELPFDSAAVALFVERARAVEPGFELTPHNAPAVVEVCRRLDGIPLAIELAAARIRVLPSRDLARRLAEGLDVLRQDVRERPPRQRTMEAAIRWSLDQLRAGERRLLFGLSALRGELSLEAAERIAEAALEVPIDVVGSLSVLVERGLVRRPRVVEGESRYVLLTTVRAHARGELERSGEAARWHEAACEYFESWVVKGQRHYCRPSEAGWLARLGRERDNLDGVLGWASENRPEAAARIAAAMWYVWYQSGEGKRGVELAERILVHEDALSIEARAGLYGALGPLRDGIGDPASAVLAFEECRALYERMGNTNRVNWALRSLGLARLQLGALGRAREAFERALETADPDQRVPCLRLLGSVDVIEKRADGAETRFREAIQVARRRGSEGLMALCILGLGDVAGLRGDWEQAAELYERAERRIEELDRRLDMATVSLRRGRAARWLGDRARAGRAYARALAIYREAGYLPGLYSALVGVAHLVLESGRIERAIELTAGVAAWADVESVEEPAFRQVLDELVQRVRGEAEAVRFDEVWRRGETLSLDELRAIADETTKPIDIRHHEAVG